MAATPPPASVRDNTIGIALVVGAVLIGLLLLVKGYDSEGGVVADASESSQVTTTTVPTIADVTTTTAPPTTTPPAQVAVKVANASGASGLAGKTKTTLQGKGYTNITISDAPSLVTSTQIYYVEGSKGDADAVAAALGRPATAVLPMPTPPPTALSGSTVLVMAGPDLN